MRELVRSTVFRKDEKRGKDMEKLRAAILSLIENAPLDPRYRDHALKGDWTGYRDLHVEPDWLLPYRVTETELLLARTGTHSDVFGE